MERERFDLTPRRNADPSDTPSDEFEATRARNQSLLNHVDNLMHQSTTSHHEKLLQQLQQQGAE